VTGARAPARDDLGSRAVERRRGSRTPVLRGVIRSRRLPWVLLVLAVAAAGTLGSLWWGERAEDARRAEVEATAAGFLLALTNFDAATIDNDVREIRSFAIGQFADEVDETFNAERVAAIREGQATSTGKMRSVFVQELGEDTATVFAVVDGTTSNASSPAPRQDVLRVEVELIETEGGWKVNRVEILQSPSGGLVG
jgi:Mce-associated membrane protein